MISKLGKMKNSWFVKGILILTALSFMSLFGVAGYVGGMKNTPAIKVDDVVVYVDQIQIQLQREQQLARNMFGDSFEISDDIRNAMLQGIVQRELDNAIMTRMSQKYGLYVSNQLAKQIIYSQPQFIEADGRFNISKLRQMLSLSGWTEERYVNTIKRDILKQQIVYAPLANLNVPKVMVDGLAKIANTKRVFKYVKIDPEKVSVNRSISQEELEQYYADFAQDFMRSESRNVSVIFLSMSDIEQKITPTKREMEEYYQANQSSVEVAENRQVLQMIFDSEENANKAYEEVKSVKDFESVAFELAGQNEYETDLGMVEKDMLIAEVADKVFYAKKNDVIAPTQSDLGWHVMKVKDIKAGSKKDAAEINKEIVAEIRKEKAYDAAYNMSKEIEDKIAAGTTLEDIAKDLNVKIAMITALTDEGDYFKSVNAPKSILNDRDVVETAFTYNVGEISQVVETDNGFVVVRVDAINEAHVKPIEEVQADIKKMWLTNEKNAIAQEIVNDVMHDLEDGDNLNSVASRFRLSATTTPALKRSETFANINENMMMELFQEQIGTPRVINGNGGFIVAVPEKDITSSNQFSQAELNMIANQARNALVQEYAKIMLNSFAKDMDVRVKWRQIGLTEGI
ncbi:MAG: peptidyl-prolyl cis-trans isomerase [Lactobacillus sp.]|jgi:peptidyl-prolyl cis-trans isomerase D|nr:peptidyl-prolyl cis-trans isomerase [Lactobacillus sp.]